MSFASAQRAHESATPPTGFTCEDCGAVQDEARGEALYVCERCDKQLCASCARFLLRPVPGYRGSDHVCEQCQQELQNQERG